MASCMHCPNVLPETIVSLAAPSFNYCCPIVTTIHFAVLCRALRCFAIRERRLRVRKTVKTESLLKVNCTS